MVSNLYSAKNFFKLQSEGKVASNTPTNKKLRIDSKGFYLNKAGKDGTVFRQRVKNTDKLYARSGKQGVTMYSVKRDIQKTDVTHTKEGTKAHSKTAHMDDRSSLSSKRNFKV